MKTCGDCKYKPEFKLFLAMNPSSMIGYCEGNFDVAVTWVPGRGYYQGYGASTFDFIGSTKIVACCGWKPCE